MLKRFRYGKEKVFLSITYLILQVISYIKRQQWMDTVTMVETRSDYRCAIFNQKKYRSKEFKFKLTTRLLLKISGFNLRYVINQ